MPQLTVQQFTIKKDEAGNPKKDNYGNTQMMIKFAESPETVYKAVKDPATVTEGKVMYGTIVEGQYGFKFKSDPFNQPGTPDQLQQTPVPIQAQSLPLSVMALDSDDKELLLAIYKAITGEDYTKEVKDTVEAEKPPVEAYEVSDEELNEELGF